MSEIDRSKPILVFLAASVQGAAVLRATLARRLKVRALVRSRASWAVPEMPGVELVEADLDDGAALRFASAGVDHAVLQLPIGSHETMVARAEGALSAFTAAGLKSFILKLSSASRPAPCEEASFVANWNIEKVARASGLPFATVRPTMYLDNLLKHSARAEIVATGVFEPPIAASQRIAWTTADDCAHAALTLLERGSLGGDHRIAGPDSLTGHELAERISAGLGRTVRYRAQSVATFEREVETAMGAERGRRIASKFRYFAAHPADAETILGLPFAPQQGLKGFRPTDVATWVRAHRTEFAMQP